MIYNALLFQLVPRIHNTLSWWT